MKKNIYIWKPVGFAPLEIIKKFKEKFSEFENETISYAGRLDPMAEGVLIILIGDENKKRDSYLKLKKEYESEVILGISTDTFDSLGLITDIDFIKISKGEIKKALKSFLGKQKQAYPPYSSKVVNGKPLFWWTRQGRINEIEIPDHEIDIYSIKLLELDSIKSTEVVNQIIKQINSVRGDFRQKEIIKSWEIFGDKNKDKELIKIKIRVSCSSGTYIRRIADDLGGFALSIKRTKIGDIEEKDALKII